MSESDRSVSADRLRELEAVAEAVRVLDAWLQVHPSRRIAACPGGGVRLTLQDAPGYAWAVADDLVGLASALPLRVEAPHAV